ncbi:MAG: hypothetical protein IPF64_10340 [Flavobacteriales bacterium]|nr:hypothetical protein [Flavobacteriales bacterium]
MHTKFIVLLLVASVSCSFDPERTADAPSLQPTSLGTNPLRFDIIQSSCALYVAVRSSAWNGPIAFGGEMNDSKVHWNYCPGGDKVACVKTPTTSGDTLITGIPWSH